MSSFCCYRFLLLWVLLFAVLVTLLPIVLSQDPDSTGTLGTDSTTLSARKTLFTPRGHIKSDVTSIALCVVLVFFGLAYEFYGYQQSSLTMFVTGAVFFSELVFCIVFIVLSSANTGAQALGALVALGLSCIGGIAFLVFSHKTMPFVGLLLSSTISGIIRAVIAPYTLPRFLPLIFFALLSVVGGFSGRYYLNMTAMASITIYAAYVVMVGMDFVLNTGFVYEFQKRWESDGVKGTHGRLGFWIQFGAAFLLWILGFAWQYRHFSGLNFGERSVVKKVKKIPIIVEKQEEQAVVMKEMV